jgi:hypothetical protein
MPLNRNTLDKDIHHDSYLKNSFKHWQNCYLTKWMINLFAYHIILLFLYCKVVILSYNILLKTCSFIFNIIVRRKSVACSIRNMRFQLWVWVWACVNLCKKKISSAHPTHLRMWVWIFYFAYINLHSPTPKISTSIYWQSFHLQFVLYL